MQKPQIVAYVLVPADQHAPEAIHPTMGAFHHPPPCLETELLLERLGLLAPGPDVGGEPELGEQVADLVEVIAFIQAHPLRPSRGWLWPRDRDTSNGLSGHLEVITIGAFHGEPNGDAAAFGEDAPFGADLPAVGRIPAHLFPPPSGALVIAPSIASHSQSMPFKASYSTRPLCHNARKTPAAVHSWKRRWAELLEQRSVSCSAFH